jgi:hypothetical protein
VVGLINEIPTCQQLMDGFMQEAEDTIANRLSSFVVAKAKL